MSGNSADAQCFLLFEIHKALCRKGHWSKDNNIPAIEDVYYPLASEPWLSRSLDKIEATASGLCCKKVPPHRILTTVELFQPIYKKSVAISGHETWELSLVKSMLLIPHILWCSLSSLKLSIHFHFPLSRNMHSKVITVRQAALRS